MRLTVTDRYRSSLKTQREYTPEGYLKVPGHAARTGVQEYLAYELGVTDGDPNRIIRVYRPDSEVFDMSSLASYDGKDVTVEHPKELVNSDTYEKVSAGHVMGGAVRDGDFTKVTLLIKDAKAIKAVESGKVQLSVGYTAEYEEAPSDAPYDLIQRDIKVNHVALVDVARAGPQARIFDHQTKPEEKAMPKVMLDSGRDVKVEDEATASLIEDSIQRLTERGDNAIAERDKAQAMVDSQAEKLKKAEAAASDETFKARFNAIQTTVDSAKHIAGSSFTCDSIDPVEIKRAALASTGSSIDWNDKSASYIEVAFDMKMEEMNDEDMTKMRKKLMDMGMKEDELKGMSMKDMSMKYDEMMKKKKSSMDSLAADLQNGSTATKDSQLTPYEKRNLERENAWKGDK